MGRKHFRAGKYIYLCLTSLIFFSFFGCASLEGMKQRRVARQGLLRGQELLTEGAYKESLRQNQAVYSMAGENAPGDEALFTMGLIYAHYENPDKDYKKAVGFFKKLIEEYPESTFAEQARIWVGTLDAIEKEKQVASEKEKQVASEKAQKKREVKGKEQSARKHLIRSQQLLAKGDYTEALEENRKVISVGNKNSLGDKALFNTGLIYAHYENPDKDYNKAIISFKKLIEDYPKSTLVEQAKLWVGTLEIIEQEKQVDIEIEKKKKELEKQVVKREEVSPNSEPERKISEQHETPADVKLVTRKEEELSKKKDVHFTVLEDAGGSLYFLALNYYKKANETIYELILRANPSITDVLNIDDRQKIIVPVITPESYIQEISGGGEYRVYIGTFATDVLATAFTKKVDSGEKLFFINPHQFSSQDKWYRLTMGDFKDKEEALKMVRLLEEKGLIYIPPEFDVMEKEKQVDNEKAEKKGELIKQE